jgi:isopenicillin-N epimerase
VLRSLRRHRNAWRFRRRRTNIVLGRIQKPGLPPCYPDDTFYHQMAVAQLPPIADLQAFKAQLYDDFNIEIPCTQWEDKQFIRVSIQAYNTTADTDVLLDALKKLIPANS